MAGLHWTEADYQAYLRLRGEPATATATASAKRANAGAALSAQRERSGAAPDIEGALVVVLLQAGLGGFERNYRFTPRRRLELDFAWVMQRVAVEVQGGIHSRGGHVRPDGFRRDVEKMRLAQLMGWIVLPCTAACIRSGALLADIRTAMGLRGDA